MWQLQRSEVVRAWYENVHKYVLERRLREIIDIGSYQFGFIEGRSTIGAIFIVRLLQEKYNQKKIKLYHIFIDLEKAFDRVPRKMIMGIEKENGT